jgi:hypothetical protein
MSNDGLASGSRSTKNNHVSRAEKDAQNTELWHIFLEKFLGGILHFNEIGLARTICLIILLLCGGMTRTGTAA